jgi:hypothetical protein
VVPDGPGVAAIVSAVETCRRLKISIREYLAGLDQPVTVQQLRKLCGLHTATVCSCLADLADTGVVTRDSRGYQLNPSNHQPFPFLALFAIARTLQSFRCQGRLSCNVDFAQNDSARSSTYWMSFSVHGKFCEYYVSYRKNPALFQKPLNFCVSCNSVHHFFDRPLILY